MSQKVERGSRNDTKYHMGEGGGGQLKRLKSVMYYLNGPSIWTSERSRTARRRPQKISS
jgi:hypothetical protein